MRLCDGWASCNNGSRIGGGLEVLRDCGKASFIDCRIHKGLSRKLPPVIFDHREVIDALIDDLNESRIIMDNKTKFRINRKKGI